MALWGSAPLASGQFPRGTLTKKKENLFQMERTVQAQVPMTVQGEGFCFFWKRPISLGRFLSHSSCQKYLGELEGQRPSLGRLGKAKAQYLIEAGLFL